MLSHHNITLCHPGINRLEKTISQHLFRPKMRDEKQIIPRKQTKGKKYGWLLPKEAEATPWDKICIELICPYESLDMEIRISYASVSRRLTRQLVDLKFTNP
jgi:hypothetical protein